MLYFRKLVWFVVSGWLCLIGGTLRAQTLFQNIRWQDGLSAKQIRCLHKDSSGFLWIGTSAGLDRYDGAVVRRFPDARGGQKHFVNAVLPFGGEDTLIIGLRRGILLFDKKSGRFSSDSRFKALDKKNIVTIRGDGMKRIWIGTSTGVYIYQNSQLSPVSDLFPEARKFDFRNFQLSVMVYDTLRRGIWIGGDRPLFIDFKTSHVYFAGNNPFQSPLLESKNVHAIAVDRSGNVWYGCDADQSLNYWNYKNGKLDTYYALDGKQIGEGCNSLFIDRQDRLWVSTWLFAAFLKEPGQSFHKLEYSQDQAYTIAYGHFRDAISDDQGNVWLGTINGVSKTLPKNPIEAIYKLPSFPFFLETNFAHANSITVDGKMIMACKEDGAVYYNTVDRTYRRYITTSKKLRDNRFVMTIKVGDTWWFAGFGGVYSLSPGQSVLQRFDQITKDLPSYEAPFIFQDKQGYIWFQIGGDALYRYQPTTKVCTRFDGKDPQYGLFNFADLQAFVRLANGDILFAMQGKGLLRYEHAHEHFTILTAPDIAEEHIYEMRQSKTGDIWAATSAKGLVKIDSNGKVIRSITTKDGLPYDHVSSLDIDDSGVIWAATREGVTTYDPVSDNISKVEIDLGKTLQDYWNYVTVTSGKIYAVMLDHVVVINPRHFASVPVQRPPAITSVKIFGQEKIQELKGNLLELKPDESFVAFQYASLSHRDIPSLQYNYQLVGLDDDWVVAGRNITASYTNLLPGDYVFKVRSTDENGRWMKSAGMLRVRVLPHWWQTWWFFVACALAVIGILYWVYYVYTKRLRKKDLDDTIEYFANSVYGDNSVNEICWDIARNCISKLHFEDCVVYLLDKESNKLIQKAAYGPKSPKEYEILNPIEIPVGEGIVGATAATGLPQIIADTSKDPRYIVDDLARLSELAVPILHEGQVIGVIDSEHPRKNFYNNDHVRAISTIAAISANKITEAMARAQAERQEIMLLRINKMLAESQLMALRAQMNPHFIFNCLNSIQECIVTEKYAEASKYLNKFAKLFRLVLNNSGRNLVTIAEERDVLELYLELELMRFGQGFTYSIDVDSELEDDYVRLPSMLLQPFVENGLWHGLMHKEGTRHMRISFFPIGPEQFACEIEDNGIGRKKSAEMKLNSSRTREHESQGIRICEDRIDVLARQGNHARLEVIDRYDAAGNPSGTLVRIELSTYLYQT
ncbi:histidine kinase [Dyadobacter sp. CY261]|uniref:histidine kinase n=1 Tax=Dyadobacter sp. CY261 TaxID=2907203 RepID=UPI001F420284|nr:histidine kinase [Dyadobacter sp. CY261]MCF0074690.1 histidine kinase [Dyadobacter sp. CY261]